MNKYFLKIFLIVFSIDFIYITVLFFKVINYIKFNINITCNNITCNINIFKYYNINSQP